MDLIFIFVCYVFAVASLCYVVFSCYEQARHTKKMLKDAIEQRETDWFYVKTKIGQMQLDAAKRRGASKEYILFRKIMFTVGMIAFSLILFYLIIDLFQNGLRVGPFGNPVKN